MTPEVERIYNEWKSHVTNFLTNSQSFIFDFDLCFKQLTGILDKKNNAYTDDLSIISKDLLILIKQVEQKINLDVAPNIYFSIQKQSCAYGKLKTFYEGAKNALFKGIFPISFKYDALNPTQWISHKIYCNDNFFKDPIATAISAEDIEAINFLLEYELELEESHFTPSLFALLKKACGKIFSSIHFDQEKFYITFVEKITASKFFLGNDKAAREIIADLAERAFKAGNRVDDSKLTPPENEKHIIFDPFAIKHFSYYGKLIQILFNITDISSDYSILNPSITIDGYSMPFFNAICGRIKNSLDKKVIQYFLSCPNFKSDESKDHEGYTAFAMACKNPKIDEEIIGYFLKNPIVDPNITSGSKNLTPFEYLLENKQATEDTYLEFIQRSCVDINRSDNVGSTPLIKEFKAKNYTAARLLLGKDRIVPIIDQLNGIISTNNTEYFIFLIAAYVYQQLVDSEHPLAENPTDISIANFRNLIGDQNESIIDAYDALDLNASKNCVAELFALLKKENNPCLPEVPKNSTSESSSEAEETPSMEPCQQPIVEKFEIEYPPAPVSKLPTFFGFLKP